MYHLLPTDLRLSPTESLAPFLTEPDHNGSPVLSNPLPTLLLFECVLAYMTPAASDAIIAWFVEYFSGSSNAVLGGIVYEMFGLGDSFGKVMLNNLKVAFVVLFCTTMAHLSIVQERISAWCGAISRCRLLTR